MLKKTGSTYSTSECYRLSKYHGDGASLQYADLQIQADSENRHGRVETHVKTLHTEESKDTYTQGGGSKGGGGGMDVECRESARPYGTLLTRLKSRDTHNLRWLCPVLSTPCLCRDRLNRCDCGLLNQPLPAPPMLSFETLIVLGYPPTAFGEWKYVKNSRTGECVYQTSAVPLGLQLNWTNSSREEPILPSFAYTSLSSNIVAALSLSRVGPLDITGCASLRTPVVDTCSTYVGWKRHGTDGIRIEIYVTNVWATETSKQYVVSGGLYICETTRIRETSNR